MFGTGPSLEHLSSAPPRHYRALRRYAKLIALLVAWNAGLWCYWNFEANRRLRAFVSERRALGEPVLAEDFQTTTAPKERNAVEALIDVRANLLRMRPVPRIFAHIGRTQELESWEFDGSAAVMASIDALVQQTRRALERPHFQFIDRIYPPDYDDQPLESTLVVAGFLRLAGRAHVHLGSCAEACRIFADLAEISERFCAANDDPFHGASVLTVSTNEADLLVDLLSDQCAAQLDLAPVVVAHQALLSASEERVRSGRAWFRLRRDLIEGAFRLHAPVVHYYPGAVRALRLQSYSAPRWLSILSYGILPQVKLIALRQAREMTHAFEIHRRGQVVPGLAANVDLKRTPAVLQFRGLMGPSTHARTIDWLHDRELSAVALARATSVAIACHAFSRKYGQLPNALLELQPEFLAEIPADPFSLSGAAIPLRADLDPPRVFSVGRTGAFDGLPDFSDFTLLRERSEGEVLILLSPAIH